MEMRIIMSQAKEINHELNIISRYMGLIMSEYLIFALLIITLYPMNIIFFLQESFSLLLSDLQLILKHPRIKILLPKKRLMFPTGNVFLHLARLQKNIIFRIKNIKQRIIILYLFHCFLLYGKMF